MKNREGDDRRRNRKESPKVEVGPLDSVRMKLPGYEKYDVVEICTPEKTLGIDPEDLIMLKMEAHLLAHRRSFSACSCV